MTEVMRAKWAVAFCNEKFICVKTYSGYRGGSHADPKGSQHFLSVDASDEEIGVAVQDALERSRLVLPAPKAGTAYPPEVTFDLGLYDYKLVNERYEAWVGDLIGRYGYKTKRALFKNMKSASIASQGESIIMQPSHHEQLDEWSGDGIAEEHYVTISALSKAGEVGKALRLAFSRCTA